MAAEHCARHPEGVGLNFMTRATHSRLKYLRLALSEAVRAGDREAAKRLTKKVFSILAN
jgi:hypothetical protein